VDSTASVNTKFSTDQRSALRSVKGERDKPSNKTGSTKPEDESPSYMNAPFVETITKDEEKEVKPVAEERISTTAKQKREEQPSKNAPLVETITEDEANEAKSIAEERISITAKQKGKEQSSNQEASPSLEDILDAAHKSFAVATKADDAEIPTHIWDQRAHHLEEDLRPTKMQQKALDMLRKLCLKFWKRSTIKDLCKYLDSPSQHKSGQDIKKTRKIRNTSPLTDCGSHVHKDESRPMRK
jgi:uncharacterized membrane protein YheB (UPF0754 family)